MFKKQLEWIYNKFSTKQASQAEDFEELDSVQEVLIECLETYDSGFVLACDETGTDIFIQALDEDKALRLIMELCFTDYVRSTYATLLTKFPGLEAKFQQALIAREQQIANQQQPQIQQNYDADAPVISPLSFGNRPQQ